MGDTLWRPAAEILANQIEKAEGVGKVIVGEEDVDTITEILELAAHPLTDEDARNEQQKVNFWQVLRSGVSTSRSPDLPRGQRWRIHGIRIRGYLGMGEGTWDRFQDIVDSVLDNLEGINNLALTRETSSTEFIDVEPPTVAISYGRFSVYGCHQADIAMTLRERRLVNLIETL